MSRSALNTAGNIAYAAKSIYKMIKAFLRGGWYAAIHPIRDQFVGDFGSVEQTGRIGLFYFDVPMFHSAESSSIRIGKNNNF